MQVRVSVWCGVGDPVDMSQLGVTGSCGLRRWAALLV